MPNDPWENEPTINKIEFKIWYIRQDNGQFLETTAWLGEEYMDVFTEAQMFCDYHDLILVDMEPIDCSC